MVAYLLITASLVFIPLIVIAASRLTEWAQFRAARGPGVPPTVPEAWLRAYYAPRSDPPATAG